MSCHLTHTGKTPAFKRSLQEMWDRKTLRFDVRHSAATNEDLKAEPKKVAYVLTLATVENERPIDVSCDHKKEPAALIGYFIGINTRRYEREVFGAVPPLHETALRLHLLGLSRKHSGNGTAISGAQKPKSVFR